MQPSISNLVVALMTAPLATIAVAVPAELTPAPPTGPHGEVAAYSWIPKPEGISEPPAYEGEANTTSVVAAVASDNQRAQCRLELRWTDNWTDVCGRRYRVRGVTHGDGGNNWNTWEMTERWVTACRSVPNNGQNPAAWQDSVDPAVGYCDVCFVHGSQGHSDYLRWHETASSSWLRSYSACYVDSAI